MLIISQEDLGKNFQKKKRGKFSPQKTLRVVSLIKRLAHHHPFESVLLVFICFGEVLLSKYSNTPEEEEEGYIPSWGKSMHHPPEATLTTNEKKKKKKKKTCYWYSTCVI